MEMGKRQKKSGAEYSLEEEERIKILTPWVQTQQLN